LTTGGESIVNISYPNDDSSKYIALFGFDELFENLSDNISYLTIVNKSNDTLDLDIPETISKFQNLVALVLENCVKTIPEELGQCENLMFLTLQKNRNLESLPDSLADLELLELISLSDSNPSIRIPERLKAIMVDEGNGFYAINKD
jgi:hypothetical protein